MKHLFSLLSIAVFISCQTNLVDDTSIHMPRDTFVYDCEYIHAPHSEGGRIDSTERKLRIYCSENNYSTKRQIVNNLIGEWELVGFAYAWIYGKSQPCGYIKFYKDSLVFQFEDANRDTTTVHAWEVVMEGSNWFTLETYPKNYFLGFNCFSDKYMYYNNMGLDGDFHLYEKVQ